MSSEALTLRYGHSEGLTEICYDDSGKVLVSCGFDGNVRIWKDLDDDDEISLIKCGDKLYSVAVKGNMMYTAPDNQSVDCYTFPKGEQDGILLRFTGNATCLDVSESKKYISAGSSDFDIKVINVGTKKLKCYLGHQAPILNVALDPMDEYMASTSCDGYMKIWEIGSEKCLKTLPVVTKSNDIENSDSLARICWRPSTGEDIAVPASAGVDIFARVTWAKLQSLTTDATTKPFQCCSFSPCGRFIAAASVDGWVVVWDAETQESLRKLQHPLKACITCIKWNPLENNSLAFSDTRGQIGVLEDVVSSENPTKPAFPDDLDALFEEDDDNMMVDMMAEEADDLTKKSDDLPSLKKKSRSNNLFASDDKSDAGSKKSPSQNYDLPPIPSTLEVLQRDDDLYLTPTLPLPSNAEKLYEDDEASSVAAVAGNGQFIQAQPTYMQPAFQASSTPVHLSHRFMVWNAIGIIRAYNDETENAVDVEFHDTKTHHSLHLPNHDHYTMADLSDRAAVLAAESSTESTSKLKCVHFSSWDNNKEWTTNMSEGENIKALTLGDCWIAVATSAFQVRLFSLGGIQRQIFSIPGPVVTMSAHTDQLLIVYHIGHGFSDNQSLGFTLLEVGAGTGCHPRKVVGGQPLPISPGSTLTWLGFTAEGTPASVDSEGVVRVMNREFCGTWVVVANTRKMVKSRHDHYWVVGLHENPQQIRCILCKGSTYPATLPRPTITVQNYKLPLCEMEGDKGKLEEEYWRTRLFSSYGDYLVSRGYEPDETSKNKSKVEIQQLLMRVFAICCKTDQDFEAYEVCSLMPTSASVNLAIKYSSRIRKIALAQRLQEVAQEKLLEEQEAAMKEERRMQNGEESEEDEEDFRAEIQAGYSATETEWSTSRSRQIVKKRNHEKEATDDNDDDEEEEEDVVVVESQAEDEEEISKPTKVKPVRSLSSQLGNSRRNPFKKTANPETPSGSVLDGIKRSTPNQQKKNPFIPSESNRKGRGKDTKKKMKSVQPTLLSNLNLTSTPKPKRAGTTAKTEVTDTTLKEKTENGKETTRKMSGVQLFIEEKLKSVQEENPDMDGIEARKEVIQLFRSLSPAEKTDWNGRAKGVMSSNETTTTLSSVPKRKRDTDVEDENCSPQMVEEQLSEEETPAKNQKLDSDDVSIVKSTEDSKTKLAAFAFARN